MNERVLTYRQAVAEAIAEEMRRDKSVFLMGEDVGKHGGAFAATKGLFGEFGPERVRDTPISESVIAGAGVGAALTGMRPIVEIMYMDFMGMAMDSIVNQAAKVKYMFGGHATVPLTIRTAFGAGRGNAAQHSQSLETWLTLIPGLIVVMPSTPYDAKGLLKSAIRNNNPVIVIENKLLYGDKGVVPAEDDLVPIGKAAVRREGKDVTLIATSRMCNMAGKAIEELEKESIDVEFIDPRTIKPLDTETIAASIEKTHHAVVVSESHRTGGFTNELSARIVDECFYDLDAPVVRVAAEDVPIPYNARLEAETIPAPKDIVAAVREVLS
ncbi:MAG: alpha-ketoacid dehydrogenase subunit beta [Ardenticatenia bacterium]|nr:alpha-ketoacid dehydrogenase subunit beta [Ardenticatenia bacterium]